MRCGSVLVLLACFLVPAPARAAERDPVTGLIVGPGWELVRAYCGACHSYRIVTSQRGDARFWSDTIRWMQRTQNLATLPADHERSIVDYLAGNYAESEWGRRPGLSKDLLPLPAR